MSETVGLTVGVEVGVTRVNVGVGVIVGEGVVGTGVVITLTLEYKGSIDPFEGSQV